MRKETKMKGEADGRPAHCRRQQARRLFNSAAEGRRDARAIVAAEPMADEEDLENICFCETTPQLRSTL